MYDYTNDFLVFVSYIVYAWWQGECYFEHAAPSIDGYQAAYGLLSYRHEIKIHW